MGYVNFDPWLKLSAETFAETSPDTWYYSLELSVLAGIQVHCANICRGQRSTARRDCHSAV